MKLSLEHVDPAFGVSNFKEFCAYSWKNLQYTFYFGHKTMFEYTEHKKVVYGTRKSYFEKNTNVPNKNHVSNMIVKEASTLYPKIEDEVEGGY
jgi:hypothetical protein